MPENAHPPATFPGKGWDKHSLQRVWRRSVLSIFAKKKGKLTLLG